MMNNLMLKVTQKKISYQIKNVQLELTTDAGVFQKIMWILDQTY